MDIIKNTKKIPPKLLNGKPTRTLVEKPKNAGLLINPLTAKNTSLISWEAPEFVYYEKTAGWYIVIGLIGIGLTIYAIATKNPIMAITFGLIFIVMFLYAEKKPPILKFGIASRGIKIQDRIYYFNQLESFWIFYDPPTTKFISIKSKKTLMPLIRIPLDKANPLEIRKVLLQYLKEDEQHESLIDIITRIIRF